MQVVLMWMPGPLEWAIIGVVALVVFGRRLPDVARSMGKSIVEFKKGIRDVEDDINTSSRRLPPSKPAPPLEQSDARSSDAAGSESAADKKENTPAS